MFVKKSAILFLILIASPVLAKTPKKIRVRILEKYAPKKLTLTEWHSNKLFSIELKQGQMSLNGKAIPKFKTEEQPVKNQERLWRITLPRLTRFYQGELELEPKKGLLKIVNEIPIEQYLVGVLAAEFAQASPEALRAQAVLARTTAYKLLKDRKNRDYQLDDLTRVQAYSGYHRLKKLHQAVKQTAGEVLIHQGEIIQAFWHSTCGRNFFTPDSMWGGERLNYLRSIKRRQRLENHLCADLPHFFWERKLSLNKIRKILEKGRSGIIFDRYPIFEKDKIQIGKNKFLYPENFRLRINRVMGWNFLKSNDYRITIRNGVAHFSGYGLGHNIGMCQCEANQLGKQGYGYRDILKNYYVNTTIRQVN